MSIVFNVRKALKQLIWTGVVVPTLFWTARSSISGLTATPVLRPDAPPIAAALLRVRYGVAERAGPPDAAAAGAQAHRARDRACASFTDPLRGSPGRERHRAIRGRVP